MTDGGVSETTPKVTYADEYALRGRGLGMVSMLAHSVAIHDNGHGRTVTAELLAGPYGAHPW
ncbi:hypothetical protein ACFWNG_02335 [Streptomyces sp. NPDC058391]|uniref:hypothetical protein n=1 Tax=Streptomyces sp. NPDC058391 TaxID=3346476 RepID=UPI003654630A